MSGIRVSNLRGEAGAAPTFPDGAIVTGVTTSTSFAGNLTGDVTGNIVGDVTGNVTGNISGTTGSFTGAVSGASGSFSSDVSIGGTITYEDVSAIAKKFSILLAIRMIGMDIMKINLDHFLILHLIIIKLMLMEMEV